MKQFEMNWHNRKKKLIFVWNKLIKYSTLQKFQTPWEMNAYGLYLSVDLKHGLCSKDGHIVKAAGLYNQFRYASLDARLYMYKVGAVNIHFL
jgi:hypothetical protein